MIKATKATKITGIRLLKQSSIQVAIIAFSFFLVSCGGGSSDRTNTTGVSTTTIEMDSCTGFCAEQNPNAFLANTSVASSVVGDVQKVLSQAVSEARARSVDATIAVTDRSGNVLAVLRTNLFGGANNTPPDAVLFGNPNRRVVTIGSASEGRNVSGGLEKVAVIPDELAAIAKSVTASYLSTEGNAFTTRTASFIIQEHFIPGEADDKESGPLFGVQFTQLACSDLNNRFIDGVQDGSGPSAVDGSFGPKRSPLGLSADPGGMPLYKFGTPVGGVGVISDGLYSFDRDSLDIDSGIKIQDEVIALAATFGFASPPDRRASLISLDGRLARFSDATFSDLLSDPTQASPLTFPTTCATGIPCLVRDANNVVIGELISVRGYYNSATAPVIKQGVRFSTNASGFVAATTSNAGELAANNNDLDAFVLVDDNGINRFPAIASEITNGLTQDDVVSVLRNVIAIANKSRAQIRRPLGTPMRATASIVDSNGVVLGILRTRDGPVFGIDTSLQKARTSAFFSHANAAVDLANAPDLTYPNVNGTPGATTININDSYVGSVASGKGIRGFLQDDTALTGLHAFADRSGGNLSRPFFPDGIEGIQSGVPNKVFGPFSKPYEGEWSIFNNGLQLDLSFTKIIRHILFAAGVDVDGDGDNSFSDVGDDVDRNCSSISRSAADSGVGVANATKPLANGIQIFPGSVPIYKNGVLVGGIGVSGDGVDQDDMASFLGLYHASLELGGLGIGASGTSIIGHAPKAIRADTIDIPNQTTRLRYIQCPQTPFINSAEQNVCGGK